MSKSKRIFNKLMKETVVEQPPVQAAKEAGFVPPPNNRDYTRWPAEHVKADGGKDRKPSLW